MKKIALLMIMIMIVTGLCSCSVMKEDAPSEKQIKEDAPSEKQIKEDAPSEKQIKEDLSLSFAERVAGAEMISSNKIKSLTNEKKYEITLELLAQEASAEWKYNVDMAYTKYDEGWMVDSVVFDKGTIVKAIVPSKEEMQKVVEDFLVMEDRKFAALTGIDWNSVSVEDIGDNQFKATWENIILYKHAKQSLTHESNWNYNTETKMWTITKNNDYQILTRKEESVFDYDALLDKAWVSEQGITINTINVSEFSAEKCVLKWKVEPNEKHELFTSGRFQVGTTSYGNGNFKLRSSKGMTRKYYDEQQDMELDITFNEDNTTFYVYRTEPNNHFIQFFYGEAK